MRRIGVDVKKIVMEDNLVKKLPFGVDINKTVSILLFASLKAKGYFMEKI
jgi:hypothetical protein